MKSPLSSIHKTIHADTLALARRIRSNGAAHARLLALARSTRFYFSTLRRIGE
jgi:hypothetical protein